jgi:hypothetical protein
MTRSDILLIIQAGAIATFALLCHTPGAVARDALTTAPTTAPAGRPTEAQLVHQLGSPDPAERDRAREQLMLLSIDELPRLRAAIDTIGAAALSPGQVALLRDVVLQVYATGDHRFTPDPSYDGGEEPRMGIMFPQTSIAPIVMSRSLGMDAYRVLQDGDSIVALLGPDAPPEPRPNDWQPINVADELRAALTTRFKVGDYCTLRVLRDGKLIEVDVRLSRVPKPPEQAVVGGLRDEKAITDERRVRATKYWTTEFATPLKLNP